MLERKQGILLSKHFQLQRTEQAKIIQNNKPWRKNL